MGIAYAAQSFCTTATKTWLVSAGAVLILEFSRPFSGDGNTFNFLILLVTLALFYYTAWHLRHATAAGVRPLTHSTGGLICLVAWSVAFATLNTLSSLIALKRNFFYLGTDSFFVTDIEPGMAVYSSADPFVASTESSNLALTFAVHLVCLAGVAALGLFLGTIQARWNIFVVIAFVALCLFIAWRIMWWMYDHDINVAAPIPGVFIFMVPLAVIAAVGTVILSNTVTFRK